MPVLLNFGVTSFPPNTKHLPPAAPQQHSQRNSEVECAIRDRRIFHLWMTGKADPQQIAERYRISYVRALQIIGEQRGLWQRKYAPALPGFD